MSAVETRRALVTDYKRSLIREAARSVFARAGIEGASMRAIAAEAGYTTGALYVHFDTKEELYAELLHESLGALFETLGEALAGSPSEPSSRAVLKAFLGFYRERPQDFELSFYLHGGGLKASGLNAALDDQLNRRVSAIVDLVGEAIADDAGRPPAEARRLGTAACSYAFGLLLMDRTGRIQILGQDLGSQLEVMLDAFTHAGDDATS
jgi:TetR/AcrR family transcriptional regulator